MTCARPLVSLERRYAGNAIAAESDRCCTGGASERNRRLRGEARFTPRLMFVQPGIVYESGATLEEMVYASMISISGRISPPSGDFFFLFFLMKKNAVQYAVCPNPLLTHRQAISHHHLSSTSPWFAQPASWEGVRGLLISHIIISFHSLWHRVRTEDRHGALWSLEAQSHGGGCTRVCACVRSLSFAENISVSIHFQLAKVHRRSSNDLYLWQQ